jgi:hypothetical protein
MYQPPALPLLTSFTGISILLWPSRVLALPCTPTLFPATSKDRRSATVGVKLLEERQMRRGGVVARGVSERRTLRGMQGLAWQRGEGQNRLWRCMSRGHTESRPKLLPRTASPSPYHAHRQAKCPEDALSQFSNTGRSLRSCRQLRTQNTATWLCMIYVM